MRIWIYLDQMKNEEAAADDLAAAIESQHGGTATFSHEMPVVETWRGKTAWKGTVQVFDLAGHPAAKRA